MTNQEKLEAVEREIGYRRRVYPRLIAEGKMTQRRAVREIFIFEEIAKDYARIVEQKELPL